MIPGIGPDAPTTTNARGGKQSATPYRFDLLPARAMFALSRVLAHGATKYGPDNWRQVSIADHVNHAMAHIMGWLAGDRQDDHMAHALCRLAFAVELVEDTRCSTDAVEPEILNALERLRRRGCFWCKTSTGDQHDRCFVRGPDQRREHACSHWEFDARRYGGLEDD